METKSFNSMGIQLLKELRKTTNDQAYIDKIDKRISYLQAKYKNKNNVAKRNMVPSNTSNSDTEATQEDKTLVNDIKNVPLDPVDTPNVYTSVLEKTPEPIRKHMEPINPWTLNLRNEYKKRIGEVVDNLTNKNTNQPIQKDNKQLRNILDSIDPEFEIAELNIKLVRKI